MKSAFVPNILCKYILIETFLGIGIKYFKIQIVYHFARKSTLIFDIGYKINIPIVIFEKLYRNLFVRM